MGVNHMRQKALATTTNDANSNEEASNSIVLRKEWLDNIVIRYPFDFDAEGRPTEALRQQCIMTLPEAEGDGDGVNKRTSQEWLMDNILRRDLLHHVLDEHDYTHRGNCFKGGKVECRGHLPEMASNESTIFDNNAIHAIQQDDRQGRDMSDSDEDKAIINCHHLNGEIEQKSQYAILPRRTNGSQFLNQFNEAISKVLACNTNVNLGDPSHTFYTTLYKSKNTQAEDKNAFQRVQASLGRRLWRVHQQQQEQEKESQQQNQDQEAEDATIIAPAEASSPSEILDDDEDKERACFVEGLGRVMTGVNALLSRDVVSSTMAHLLISQGGERFTYSHEFTHILLKNMENSLEEKDGMNFCLRRNWNADTKETVAWADSSAYDFIHRPDELNNLCLYEYSMWYEKEYKSFKQLNKKSKSAQSGSYKFADGHPGQNYCHLKRRKQPVIPIINMVSDLSDIKSLDVLDDSTTDSGTLQRRERYAKTAMMLFYPFRTAKDLMQNDSHWQKFVDVGGTKEYDEATGDTVGLNPSSAHFWNRGRMILENIETRRIAEKEMKRPKRKITHITDTPKSTGKRKRQDIDKDDGYDVDISDFFNDDNDDGVQQLYASEPKPLADTDLRSHGKIMKRAGIRYRCAIKTHFDKNATVLATEKESPTSAHSATRSGNSPQDTTDTDADKHQQPAPPDGTAQLRYKDVLTFIQGSLLVGGTGEEAVDGDGGMNNDDMDINNDEKRLDYQSQSSSAAARSPPCMRSQRARVLVMEGDQYDTKLGHIGATLGPLDENLQRTKEKIILILKERGGMEQLVMFITGQAGCGKSKTMEAAQHYCHRFCSAIAAAFNNKTFYFTATTGSAAAMFGGTTIHSAGHLNKSRINDEMRDVWRDEVRILIIDEISFFKASDVINLDRQLKKLTGRYDAVYGGVSVVFSGDFHQLKPICAEEDVLYSNSDAASVWENTINCAIFLDNNHRFKDDHEFGEILARMRMGTDTRDDREKINERVVGPELTLPEHTPDACFACATNKERNGVTAATFKKHIEETHPAIADDSPPPDHTLIIEAAVSIANQADIEDENEDGETSTTGTRKKKKRKRRKRVQRTKAHAAFHDTVVTQLGDDNIKSTDFASKGAKIEPALRVYPGSHHMCITNEDLDQGRGNGTLCKFLRVKLRKDGRERRWKNWDGKKVWTVSIDDVEWMEFEHYPTPTGTKARTFKLKPQEFTATIKIPATETLDITLGNAKVKQIPVNSNIATTGHKLQGMSKDVLIINNWDYRCANWVYVVLSRVRTLAGLYLMKPLDLERSFNVPQSLIRFEQRLRDNKERPILEALGYQSRAQAQA